MSPPVVLLDLSTVSLPWLAAAFALAGAVILLAGTRLARRADRIADQTGIGEALAGAVFLGATTSLPGTIVSVVSAGFGHTELAISNAIGGIAAQTAFLGVADIAYRRANLEHAAASFTNLTQGALLVVLLAIPLVATSTPSLAVLGVSPATPALVVAYVFGLRLSARARAEPMWRPRDTAETEIDVPDEAAGRSGWRSWLALGLLAACAAASGFALALPWAAPPASRSTRQVSKRSSVLSDTIADSHGARACLGISRRASKAFAGC